MARVNVVCNECGKKFKAANPERCPNCKGVDLDVDYAAVFKAYAVGRFAAAAMEAA